MTTEFMTQLALSCRRIFLRDHVVHAQIGVHEFEKNGPQRVIFNVELFVPYEHSTSKADTLTDVLDYDFVRSVIALRLQQGPTQLQETLCDDLASTLLAHPQVRAVRLSSCKPDVYPDCAGVGIEVFRTKATGL